MTQRILILSIKAGAGHLRAAHAIEQAFHRAGTPPAEVRHLDALELTPAAFRESVTRGYEEIVRHLPSVWGMIYQQMETQPVDSRMKKISELHSRLNAHGLRRLVREFNPDQVICTHYLPAEAIAPGRRKGTLRASLSMVLTDYDIHTMWIQPGTDRYFVATDEMAHALRAKGIGAAALHVTGIPILPAFSTAYPARAILRRRLGLAPGQPTILLAAGGFGMAPLAEVVSLLARELPETQLLALAGRNEALRRATAAAAEGVAPERIRVFGFVDTIHELMAASDLIVTKCGGLTSSECLAMGLPMVIIKPIPGQEQRNADFLLETGAAVKANSLAQLVYKVRALMAAPQRMRRMRAAARRAAKPGAADAIAATVLGHASPS